MAAAQTLHHVLERAGDELTRENVMRIAADIDNLALPIMLPGVTLDTGPKDYFPIECLRLQRFNGENWEIFGESICDETADE